MLIHRKVRPYNLTMANLIRDNIADVTGEMIVDQLSKIIKKQSREIAKQIMTDFTVELRIHQKKDLGEITMETQVKRRIKIGT